MIIKMKTNIKVCSLSYEFISSVFISHSVSAIFFYIMAVGLFNQTIFVVNGLFAVAINSI